MSGELLAALAQFGALGIVAGWLMFRVEARMDRLERALDRLTRAQLLLIIRSSDTEEPLRRQARTILKEMNGGPRLGVTEGMEDIP